MKVLCVTGMPGCGKEEVLKVAEQAGFRIVRMGDVVRAEAQARGLPMTDAAVGGMAHQDRAKFGMDIWAQRTLPLVTGDRVLIDGLRGRAELDVFRRAYGDDLYVAAVHASPRTRYNRIGMRKRKDDVRSWQAFLERDERELSWGLGDVVAKADFMVVNESDLAYLTVAAQAILRAITG